MMNDSITAVSSVLLSASALSTAKQAPSAGFFLLATAAALSALSSHLTLTLTLVQADLQWAAEVLGPALVSFGFLWLSEDRCTAYVLLIGCMLLPALSDWLSPEGVVVMSRCLAVSALSCSLTVCLFAGDVVGVMGSLALSLPALVASPAAGLLRSFMNVGLIIGCFSIRTALHKYLQEVQSLD
uniref:Uncharacterized protein n=1 Tax=Denticeps clupeoides TaxID=299321 RepID=A0AAY4CFF6_9TELE